MAWLLPFAASMILPKIFGMGKKKSKAKKSRKLAPKKKRGRSVRGRGMATDAQISKAMKLVGSGKKRVGRKRVGKSVRRGGSVVVQPRNGVRMSTIRLPAGFTPSV